MEHCNCPRVPNTMSKSHSIEDVSPDFGIFSTYMKAGIQSQVINAGKTSWKRRGQRLSILNQSANFILSNTAPWSLQGTYTYYTHLHIFHPCWTGALENIARPHSIITTHHPSYLCIWGNVCHMGPLFLVYIKRSGSLGMRLVHCMFTLYCHKVALYISQLWHRSKHCQYVQMGYCSVTREISWYCPVVSLRGLQTAPQARLHTHVRSKCNHKYKQPLCIQPCLGYINYNIASNIKRPLCTLLVALVLASKVLALQSRSVSSKLNIGCITNS